MHIAIITFIPVIATIFQLWLLRYAPHTTWLLLYPAVFISAWLGGLRGSAIATVVASVLGIYFFIAPYGQWAISDPRYIYSILIFVLMGLALGLLVEKLERSRYAINTLAARQIKSDQERLALALASSHAGLWEWVLDNNKVTWTNTLARLYGYDESTPSSYDNWLASVDPQDQGPVVASIMEAVSQGLEFNVEWRVANRPENLQRWLSSNGKPVFDEKGKLACYRGIVLDITQRRQQEQALRDSDREFRLLAEAMPQIVWITTGDGWNIFFNQQWVDYTGLSLEQSYGHGWNIPFHPDDRQIAWEAWQNAVHRQATYSLECRLRRHDGEYRWWLTRGVPVKDADGRILKWFGTCTDIHDLKLAQDQLTQSENRYRQLFEANPLPMWIHDLESLKFLDVNTAAIAVYGYSRDEFLAMTLKDIYPPEAIELMQQAMDSTSPHQPDQFYLMASAWRHRRKDGSQFWAQIDSHRLLLDNRQAEIVLARDVSAELEAEHKLQESEARWQFALEGSDQGVWDWDIANNRVFFSSRWKSMLGYTDEEIEGRVEEWSTRIHPDDLDGVMNELHRYFDGETDTYQVEHRVRCRDGEYKWILARGIVVSRDSQDNPTRMIGTHQDISERKRIEQELIENQAKLSLFIEYAPAALAMFDPQMRYLAASARWLEDYQLQGQDIIGRCHYDLFPEIGDTWKTVHQRGLTGEVLKADHDCFVRSDGRKQWLRWEVRPWLTKEGAVGGIAIFAEDITQQILTESERQRWADAFHYCAHGIVIGNPRSNLIEDCNPAFAALLGYASPSELKGYPIPALYPADYGNKVIDYLQQCDRLGQIRYESVYRHVNGSTLDVQVDIVSVKDGDGSLLYRVATVQDISQRKHDAQTLQLQSSALNAAANAIIITDPEGIIEWINPAFTQMTGYSAEEAIGYAVDQLVKCDQHSQVCFSDILKSITPGRVWQGEIVNRRRDGSSYTVEQIINPVFDEQQCIRHFIAIKQDISVRKQNELELLQHRHHLEEMVRARTLELEAARLEAERLSDIKTRFLANMSHEIRTPMHAVLGFCYLLEQRSLDRESQELVSNIHKAGNSLLGIINDILDFSKIEAGRLDIETKPFSLLELLDELASLMMTVASKKNLELIIVPPVSVDGLLGDKQRLQQVLVNLLGNAIKFTDQGEVVLHIDVAQLPDESEALRFRVRDTGIGISSDHLAEVFSAFNQADSSISRRFGGTGLGLAISKRLVELMGGKLEVSSQQDVGSEFYFQLPLQRSDSGYLVSSSLQCLSLLIADDCPSAREALSNTIDTLGWQADTVDSGDAALQRVMARWQVQKPYDVLLLDWQMPGKDGLETAHEIQSVLDSQFGERDRAPIVIMVTAHDKDLLQAQPGVSRVDSILSKPVTASTLYSTIAAIAWHRDREQAPEHSTDKDFDGSIHGVRVLLVDDSEFNLELALRILQGHGAVVHTACNGQEALVWLNDHPDSVDIILMDIQMPVMDGYSVTRLIRQDSRWNDLPIVALSAGVLKDEQEKALATGMNDFISKPFKVDHFLATIRRLVKRQSTKPLLQTVMPPSTANDSQPDNLPDIDISEGLSQWDKAEVYKTYLGKFVESYSTSDLTLADLFKKQDQVTASAFTHKLKGAAANLALKKVAGIAGELEAALRRGIFSVEILEALKRAIEQASIAIAGWQPDGEILGVKPPAPQLLEHPDQLLAILKQLLLALDQDNPAIAEPLLTQLKNRLPSAELADIQAKLAMFDFRGAESSTLAVIKKMNLHDSQK